MNEYRYDEMNTGSYYYISTPTTTITLTTIL